MTSLLIGRLVVSDMINNTDPVFILDANLFIEAYQRYYEFDICPGFWQCLEHYCREHRVVSIDRVKDELVGRGDALSDWAVNAPQELFTSSLEVPVTEVYREVMIWIYSNQQFFREGKDKFSNGADGWLVAYAKAYGGILVTHEEPRPNAKKRVPLPNVCHQFNVEYRNTFDMLRQLGVRFAWGNPAQLQRPAPG